MRRSAPPVFGKKLSDCDVRRFHERNHRGMEENKSLSNLKSTAQIVECNCGIDGCESCETDQEECTDNTRIEIPDWENGAGIILSPTWYAAPTGSPEGDELGMDDYSKANAEFPLCYRAPLLAARLINTCSAVTRPCRMR